MTDRYLRNSKNDSDKKMLSIAHLLHPYVKQRIKVGENLGIFPKRMFQTNEIIDDVILSIYEHDKIEEFSLDQLKIIMFNTTNKKLKRLFEDEKWHQKSISTKYILEEELNQLEEKFTVNADNDLIMTEELDDISYHQVEYVEVLPYEDEQDIVYTFLDLKENSDLHKKNMGRELTRSYYELPVQTSNIVDLYILGKLNMQEISHILDIEIVEVKRIIDFTKKKFIKYVL